MSSVGFVFRKSHPTTVPLVSITPHIYPPLLQVWSAFLAINVVKGDLYPRRAFLCVILHLDF